MSKHHAGQVCLNGHEITGDVRSEFSSKFCGECGEATIHACPSCDAIIRGEHMEYISEFSRTSFCYACGTPYPWTERQIQAARDLVDEIDDLDSATADKAKDSFRQVVSDTPSTQLAAVRIKKLLLKAGPIVGEGIKEILISIATEAAKKQMGL